MRLINQILLLPKWETFKMRDHPPVLSKDLARIIASYLVNRSDFFSFTSANTTLHRFFKDERAKIFNERIKLGKIIGGSDSSFFLSFEGDLYGCGLNDGGQLGLGDTRNRSIWTKTGPPGKKVIQVLSQKHCSFVLCNVGLYACGQNKEWQLGLADTKDQIDWVNIGPLDKKILEFKTT